MGFAAADQSLLHNRDGQIDNIITLKGSHTFGVPWFMSRKQKLLNPFELFVKWFKLLSFYFNIYIYIYILYFFLIPR